MPRIQFMQADPQHLQGQAIAATPGLLSSKFAVSPIGAIDDGFQEALKTTGYKLDPTSQITYEVHLQAFCYSFYAKILTPRVTAVVQFAVKIRLGGNLVTSRIICDHQTLTYWDAVGPAADRVLPLCLAGAIRKAIDDPSLISAIENPRKPAHKDSSPAGQEPPDCRLSDLPEVESQQSVAVLDFQTSNDQVKAVGESFADLCRDAVLESGRFILIERESIKAILDEEDFTKTFDCDNTKCLVDFGKKLRAQKIIHGRVNRIGTSFVITIKILDVSSTKVEGLKAARVSGGLEQALDFVQPLTCEILRKSLTAKP